MTSHCTQFACTGCCASGCWDCARLLDELAEELKREEQR